MNRNERRAARKQTATASTAMPQLAELAREAAEHRRAGRFDQAVVLMQRAIAASPGLGILHSNLGGVYQAAGRLGEAEVCFRQAITLDPTLAKAHHNLAVVLEGQGQLAEAAMFYEKTLAIDPAFAEARHALFFARHKQGNAAATQMGLYLTMYWLSQALLVAAQLGVADAIKTSPRTAEELARDTGSHAMALRRVLLFLASEGIFAEDAQGRFVNTPLSDTLRADHPNSVRRLADQYGHDNSWKMWGDLAKTVATGAPAFDRVYGQPFFDYVAAHPEVAGAFQDQMSSNSIAGRAAILKVCDFSRFRTVVDVGGGRGELLHGILSAHPNVRGVLADQAHIVAGADALRAPGIAARCEIVAVNFFESVPAGADAYVLKNVIHDWDDEDAHKILVNVRKALPADGRLLLIDVVLRASNQPDPGRWGDLEMLVLLKGRERSAADFEALCSRAGFAVVSVQPTGDHGLNVAVIEARPV